VKPGFGQKGKKTKGKTTRGVQGDKKKKKPTLYRKEKKKKDHKGETPDHKQRKQFGLPPGGGGEVTNNGGEKKDRGTDYGGEKPQGGKNVRAWGWEGSHRLNWVKNKKEKTSKSTEYPPPSKKDH